MSNDLPLVSIVIPVFNGENYLKNAIDSSLFQIYKNIEVIVVDDGSTDSTESIIKSYGTKIKYFKKDNGGVATALNLGIKKAKGKYISWLSHDDEYFSDKVEKQIFCLNNLKDKNNVIVYSNFLIRSNMTGSLYSNSIKTNNTTHLVEADIRYEFLLSLFKSEINGCTLLIPKKAFEECGYFNEKLKTTQDYEAWLKFFKEGYRFVPVNENLVISRQHNNQDTKTKLKLHIYELNKLYMYAFNLFADTFNKMDLEKLMSFLRILSYRKLDDAFRYMLFSWSNKDKLNKNFPRIWLYWESLPGRTVPDYIKLCWLTIVKNNIKDFEIICLDQYSTLTYLEDLNKDCFLFEYIANKTEYIRFKLLNKFGGIYLDSDFICFRSFKPIMEKIKKVNFVCTGYFDIQKQKIFPLLGFVGSTPKNNLTELMVNDIEKYIDTELKFGKQPEWDEIGGRKLQYFLKKEYVYDAETYFSPIPIWDNKKIVTLIKNKHIIKALPDTSYGQFLSSSNLRLASYLDDKSIYDLINDRSLISAWFSQILNINKDQRSYKIKYLTDCTKSQ